MASSAFQNMRPYFTDIYCLRNDSFFFFFLVEVTHASGETVVYVYGSSTLTHKHYLVSVRHKIATRVSQVEVSSLKRRQRESRPNYCISVRTYRNAVKEG